MDIWEKVIEQIKNDLNDRDETALYEMLQKVPKDVLIGFLPEEFEDCGGDDHHAVEVNADTMAHLANSN